MTVDYKRPVNTPCVILVRAWQISYSGRKVWVKACIENGDGLAYATAKSLFILARSERL